MSRTRWQICADGLHEQLKKFPTEAVEEFVEQVSIAIMHAEAVNLWGDLDGRGHQWLLAVQRSAEQFLATDLDEQWPFPLPLRISADPFTMSPHLKEIVRFFRAQQDVRGATSRYLEEIRIALDLAPPPPSPGRPRVDPRGMLARVAFCYRESFGEEELKPHAGSFHSVVSLVLGHLSGEEQGDVSRHVRAAIDALSQPVENRPTCWKRLNLLKPLL